MELFDTVSKELNVYPNLTEPYEKYTQIKLTPEEIEDRSKKQKERVLGYLNDPANNGTKLMHDIWRLFKDEGVEIELTPLRPKHGV